MLKKSALNYFLGLRSRVAVEDLAHRYAIVRLAVSNEKIVSKFFYPWLNLVYFSIFFIDLILGIAPVQSLALRSTACLLSIVYWHLSRGRIRYITRYTLLMFIYTNVVLAIAVISGRFNSIYLSGYFIVTAGSSLLYPMKMKTAFVHQAVLSTPGILLCCFYIITGLHVESSVLFIVFCVASWIVSSLGANFRFNTSLQINMLQARARRGERLMEKEVQEKSKDLSRRKVFERQVSPSVAKWMLDNPSVYGLQELKKVVVTSMDIAGSTNKAFSLKIRVYAKVCFQILELFSNVCRRNNVTMDKFMGDGILSFVGAPQDSNGNDVEIMIRTIREFWAEYDEIQDSLESEWGGEITVRFSLSVGECLVGIFGSKTFNQYTAMGPMVNLACRTNGFCDNRRALIYFEDNTDTYIPMDLESRWIDIPEGKLKGVPFAVKCLDIEVG